MIVLKIILVGILAIGCIGTILIIDKPREPLSRGIAVTSLMFSGLIMWALLN